MRTDGAVGLVTGGASGLGGGTARMLVEGRAALLDLHVFPKRLGTPADFAQLVGAFMENELINGEVVRLDAATRL